MGGLVLIRCEWPQPLISGRPERLIQLKLRIPSGDLGIIGTDGGSA